MASHPAVSAPIVGATKEHHLDDAIASVDLVLTADEKKSLEIALHAPADLRSRVTTAPLCGSSQGPSSLIEAVAARDSWPESRLKGSRAAHVLPSPLATVRGGWRPRACWPTPIRTPRGSTKQRPTQTSQRMPPRAKPADPGRIRRAARSLRVTGDRLGRVRLPPATSSRPP